ncbi:hypothetical protein DSH65_16030 [Enterococcus faecalis]|uniref:C2H2-type domain-containing protein n=2 Tax=Enterococcus TaxID=1350 RepID=A0ABD7J2X0_ENTFL|nr:hypothetical protein [Enterococcus faecalis]EOD94086.1 hypothetical protein Q9E_01220 [Enterococcus faecalis EnGen0059]EOK57660.1 hypothetical protein Q9C_02238 [Enterococcus faecalis EnGen0063]EGO2804007.1 hypothetical protein [Enterococcus faecalis]EGO2813181.1 hypothetical protein [Enterococcus faecalis]
MRCFFEKKEKKQCVLCHQYFKNSDMSEEHYPAKSTGNDDIVALDFVKMIDSMMSGEVNKHIYDPQNKGISIEEISGDYFDNELSYSLYPKGRTTRSLCRSCNTFLGKYDEAYKKFFDNEGDPTIIKGFQILTKLKIVKAIYAKFLSVPECKGWEFDFINFLRDEKAEIYNGKWQVYCLKRDYSTDMMGLGSLETGKMDWNEGVIFELSDEKFIFHLMNFDPHECYKSMNMMDILGKNYKLVSGQEVQGGYHGQFMIQKMFEGEVEI